MVWWARCEVEVKGLGLDMNWWARREVVRPGQEVVWWAWGEEKGLGLEVARWARGEVERFEPSASSNVACSFSQTSCSCPMECSTVCSMVCPMIFSMVSSRSWRCCLLTTGLGGGGGRCRAILAILCS